MKSSTPSTSSECECVGGKERARARQQKRGREGGGSERRERERERDAVSFVRSGKRLLMALVCMWGLAGARHAWQASQRACVACCVCQLCFTTSGEREGGRERDKGAVLCTQWSCPNGMIFS
jgi:hypothetical protein